MMFNKPSLALLAIIALLPITLNGQTIAASRTIRSNSILTIYDLVILTSTTPGTFSHIEQITGMETRTVLYPGRPIRPSDIGPPTAIRRNEIITLIYRQGTIFISTEGRALGRGGIGERIQVMNLSSRSTLTGIITNTGEVRITP